MKAGVMEIAHVFVVNKADQPGADRAVTAIEQMLATDQRRTSAPPPVVRAVATTGQGIEDLVRVIDERRLAASDEGRRRDRSDRRLRDVLVRRALDRLRHDVLRDGEWEALVARVDSRRQDPYAAADALLRRLGTAGLIDHIGVATDAAEASVAFFGDLLGRSAGPAEDVRSQGVRVRFVETGDTRIEIIEAIDPDAPFAKSLRSRGPGLHHVALRVDDLEAALTRLAEAGVRLIDRRGRPGAHGTRVAFVHPSSTRGVLVELVQHGGDDRAHR
jgi:methylmalonyl-CoA epimerase